MTEINNKFVVVTLTKDEAKVWATGLERSSKPEKISAVDNNRHHHKLRQELRHKGPGLDPESKAFFEKLSEVIKPASEVLFLGHGEGKADAVHNFQSLCANCKLSTGNNEFFFSVSVQLLKGDAFV